ncbi:MFS transporter [Streptomyces monashensis]|uniref:MFS transporter n=1 Tax=Streptomyces monashensis TaxID=1678012 RepID=UPI001FEA24C8|nr:MFS transporter [Streptomyces monashensis]
MPRTVVSAPPTMSAPPAGAGLGDRLPLVMALACGVAVANGYFPQAVTPLIARGFAVGQDSAAVLATVTQLGYAAGIFLLVPLGDRLSRRPLVTALLLVTACALLAAGLAPALGPLLAAGAVVGAATVVPQILLPMAAGMVESERRGAVTGTLQAGLIGGILLARAFGGVLGEHLGWRARTWWRPFSPACWPSPSASPCHAVNRPRVTAVPPCSPTRSACCATSPCCAGRSTSRSRSSAPSAPPGPRSPC